MLQSCLTLQHHNRKSHVTREFVYRDVGGRIGVVYMQMHGRVLVVDGLQSAGPVRRNGRLSRNFPVD